MFFLLPLIAALPSPAPMFSLFGGNAAEQSTERNICIQETVGTTLLKPLKGMLFTNNVTYEQEIADLKRVISLQTLDVKTTPFGSNDITHPSWVMTMSMHVAMSYCNTSDTALLSKFGEPIPEIPEGLPIGKIKVDSVTDFNQFEGNFNPVFDKIQPSRTDGRFLISVSDDQKMIVLSWRGSKIIKDFAANFDGEALPMSAPLLTPFQDGTAQISNPKCQVPSNTTGMFMFSGFAKDMQQDIMTDHVIPKLRDVQARYPGYSVVINGHSLGAAKSFITAFYIAKFYPDINFKAVYTIEQPLVGSTAFATWMADCIGPDKIVRVVSSNDEVPWMRFAGNIQHPATVKEVFNVDSDNNQFQVCQGSLDSNCSAKYSCGQRNWDHHSRISGFQFGPFSHYIGLSPVVKKAKFDKVGKFLSKFGV